MGHRVAAGKRVSQGRAVTASVVRMIVSDGHSFQSNGVKITNTDNGEARDLIFNYRNVLVLYNKASGLPSPRARVVFPFALPPPPR